MAQQEVYDYLKKRKCFVITSEIASNFEINLSNVSRALICLHKQGLVEKALTMIKIESDHKVCGHRQITHWKAIDL